MADRAIEIWPNLQAYIRETEKKPKSQIPESKYYVTLRNAVRDKLIIAKLQEFISVASLLEPFLMKFQTDSPMLPFLCEELSLLLNNLMSKFVKQDLLDAATMQNIAKIPMSNDSYIDAKNIKIGFGAKATLRSLIADKKVSPRQVFEFRQECLVFYVTVVTKLQEKCPLKYTLARNLISLDPRLIVSEGSTSADNFEKVLDKLTEAGWNSDQESDVQLTQYKKFVSESKKYHYEEFSNFKPYADDPSRLDIFLFKHLDGKEEFKDLWRTLKMLLTLSHGQAAIERG